MSGAGIQDSVERWHAARSLVMRYGWNAVSYQILNPGIEHWFSQTGAAVIGYARWAGVRVVAGAPVCAEDQVQAVAEEFERDAHAIGDRVVFLAAGARMERHFAKRTDRRLIHVGAQPVWDPRDWPAIVQGKSSLRAQLHRAQNKGVTVSEWPPERAHDSPALAAVRREWLSSRGLPPLHFLTTSDLLGNVPDRRVFVAELASDVIAYLVATPIPARNGWLIEAWPRTRNAPNGTTHLLVHAAMSAFAASGSQYATLGIAPLSEAGARDYGGEPAWLRWSLRWLQAHGRRFYNFRGLEAFKTSLQPPAWEALFAIADGPHFTPTMLRALAGVFSAGSPALFVARALGNAVVEEARRVVWNRGQERVLGWIRG